MLILDGDGNLVLDANRARGAVWVESGRTVELRTWGNLIVTTLGPLSDNGGPTMTHALLPASVAIDAIPEPMCEVTEDQRGEPRPAGGMCDVGAFELQP